MISEHRKLHVAGVAGVGMNAIAQLLLARGDHVTGSDRFLDQGKRLPVLDLLEAQGVGLFSQDGSGLDADTDALVLSTAVEADNPDRVRAAELGICEMHRSEVLAECVAQGRAIAIAGTSGKTSCTAMLGWWMDQAGAEPNVVNGGALVNWRSSERIGNIRAADPKGWWVFEADESDRSLLRFAPEAALITTITADHFDLETSLELFRDFASKVTEVIVCGPGVKVLLEGSTLARIIEVEAGSDDSLSMPGSHNQLNISMVRRLAEELGVQFSGDWSEFRGVERRLERTTTSDHRFQMFDDYAHNPEKIAAAIRAVRPDAGRLFALWRPHGFAPLFNNLEAFAACFAQELRPGDRALLLPVFFAGGSADRSRDTDELVALLLERGINAVLVDSFEGARALLAAEVAAGDVVLSMGARDPELPKFARQMAAQ